MSPLRTRLLGIYRQLPQLDADDSSRAPPPLEGADDEAVLASIEALSRVALERSTLAVQERRLFEHGPVVVFRWRNAEGWPVEYVSPNMVNLTEPPPGEA
jgi:hypothetical protein